MTLLEKEFLDEISQLRNNPREDGFSPTQVLFGRSMRTFLPTLTEALGTNEFVENAKEKKQVLDGRKRSKYDQRSKDLKAIHRGTLVWVQNSEIRQWDGKATIISKISNRTYKILFEDGNMSFRNRKKMKIRYYCPKRSSALNGSRIRGINPSTTRGVDDSRIREINPSTTRGIDEIRIRGINPPTTQGTDDERIRGINQSRIRGINENSRPALRRSARSRKLVNFQFLKPCQWSTP